jgi:hypothetical protein
LVGAGWILFWISLLFPGLIAGFALFSMGDLIGEIFGVPLIAEQFRLAELHILAGCCFIILGMILLVGSPIVLALRNSPLGRVLIWSSPSLLAIWLIPLMSESSERLWGFYICGVAYTLVFTGVFFSPRVGPKQQQGFEPILTPSPSGRGPG